MKLNQRRLAGALTAPRCLVRSLMMATASVCWLLPDRAAFCELPSARPADVGMSEQHLPLIDKVVADGLAAGEMPGCVVLVGRRGKVVFHRAYGHRQVEPKPVPMTVDTVFDLASLTKPVATATSVMVLWERGRLRLCDPVADYLPEFGGNGKATITIFDLLTHQGGLVPDNSLADYRGGPDTAWQRICELKPRVPPGSKFIYSDVGYIVLGKLVERVGGKSLHEFSQDHVFRPLGMRESGYLPQAALRERTAPTERRDGHWMCGEVHDPRACLLGGIAGHAGLFSTARDLAIFAQMMLGNGEYDGVRVLQQETVLRMTRGYYVAGGFRGLGWDSDSSYSSNRGKSFSARAFGHGGFTGTALWIDPKLDLFVIFLSNRLHPDGKGSVNRLAGRIGTIAAEAIQDHAAPPVLTGIDVLRRDGFRQLAGRKIGLITNQTGIDREDVSTVRLLHEAKNVTLVALFSPEHGPHGKLDVPAIVDSRDAASGLPVYSLYGKTRRPTRDMLAGIDTLVFDVQDIGTRFYTYISTMGYAMEESARYGIRFVVLDRPNPIGGVGVDGPVLDHGRESFVAYHDIPVRHGMTVGELAMMFKVERGLDLELEIVRIEGWHRRDFFDDTGLRWVDPSPNMRSLTEALLYPGIGLLETTNLSVGRGTDTPFEVIGAPWIGGKQLAQSLGSAGLPGIRFQAVSFTPTASTYRNERCEGVGISITDRTTFDPLSTGFEVARQLHKLYPTQWDGNAYIRLLGSQEVLDALLAGKTVAEIRKIYQPGLENFRQRRSRYLLYQR